MFGEKDRSTLGEPLRVSVGCTVTETMAVSGRAGRVASMFGLEVGRPRTIALVPRLQIPIRPGAVVMITGPSGGGKSSLLRGLRDELKKKGVGVVEVGKEKCGLQSVDCGGEGPAGGCARNRNRAGEEDVDYENDYEQEHDGEGALVDLLGMPVAEAVRVLALAGLGEARVMMRRPSELSEGERYRWELAKAMAEVSHRAPGVSVGSVAPIDNLAAPDLAPGAGRAGWTGATRSTIATDPAMTLGALPILLADEFGSTLDRLTGAVLARSVRRWVDRSGLCFVAATGRDELMEHLEPEVLVVCEGEGEARVYERPPADRRIDEGHEETRGTEGRKDNLFF